MGDYKMVNNYNKQIREGFIFLNSKRTQEKLIELGYKWSAGGNNISGLDYKYLYLKDWKQGGRSILTVGSCFEDVKERIKENRILIDIDDFIENWSNKKGTLRDKIKKLQEIINEYYNTNINDADYFKQTSNIISNLNLEELN